MSAASSTRCGSPGVGETEREGGERENGGVRHRARLSQAPLLFQQLMQLILGWLAEGPPA